MRVFYAARKGSAAHEVEAVVSAVRQVIRRTSNDLIDPHITQAQVDFDANYARLGGWEPWQREVATGIRFSDREPHYHTYVISDYDFGRATAEILRQALEVNKLVLFFDADQQQLQKVARILTVDADNWKAGWTAELA